MALLRPNLFLMFARCDSIVLTLRWRCSAIRRVPKPEPINRSTSNSRSLRVSTDARPGVFFPEATRSTNKDCTLSLTRLCRETWATLRRVLPETIDLQIDTDGEPGNVDGDRGALGQILFNLATNARDAMPDGGTLRVRTHRVHIDEHQCAANGSAQPGDYVCISMIDTGVGMNDETQSKIFEPFFTTKPLGVSSTAIDASPFPMVSAPSPPWPLRKLSLIS